MNEALSVDKALNRGQTLLLIPVLVFLWATIAVCRYMYLQGYSVLEMVLAGIFIFIILQWICWSYFVTKWRLWAFGNVRNVHELKRKAIKQNIIHSDDSFFTKTEIWTQTDKIQWEQILEKFKEDDLFIDDTTVPEETIIYFSKVKNLLEMALGIGVLGVGIYIYLKSEEHQWFSALLMLSGIYMIYSEFKDVRNTKPQIIVNEKGIKTGSTKFYSWEDIYGEDIINIGSGNNVQFALQYFHPDGGESLVIDDLDIDSAKLLKLLEVYRGRFQQKKTITK